MDVIIPSHSVLFLDAGNTTVKTAVCNRSEWLVSPSFAYNEPEELSQWLVLNNISVSKVVCCSVTHHSPSFIEHALPSTEVLSLNHHHLPASLLDYDTPDTLGMDRFFGCYGAFCTTNRSVIVIDAGTAITIDRMDGEGRFMGGVIMPGVAELKHTLEERAPALPQVKMELPNVWPGKSTNTSLQWGKAGFLKDGIEGALKRFSEQGEESELFITGGDASFVQALINKGVVEHTLIFEGLNAFYTRYLVQG
ncbi:MAG: type III pantothenate kinase [Bacteroidota bacterium]